MIKRLLGRRQFHKARKRVRRQLVYRFSTRSVDSSSFGHIFYCFGNLSVFSVVVSFQPDNRFFPPDLCAREKSEEILENDKFGDIPVKQTLGVQCISVSAECICRRSPHQRKRKIEQLTWAICGFVDQPTCIDESSL